MSDQPETSSPPAESREARVAINAGSRYAAMAVTTVTALLLTPFLIRTLGKEAYGLQALSHQCLQFIGMAALAVGLSYQRFAAEHYAKGEFAAMNTVMSLGLSLSLISAAILMAGTLITAVFADALFGLPPDLVPTARIVLIVLGFASSCHIVNGVWKSPVFIRQRFHLESIANVVATVAAALGVWILFRAFRPSIVAWVILAAGLRLAIEWLYVIPRARRSMPEMHVRLAPIRSWPTLRSMLNFSLLNFLGIVGFLLYYATDSIIISNVNELGIGHVTDYNVAQRWDPQLRMMITSFVGALTPIMTADVAVGHIDKLRVTILRGTRYSLILAFGPCVLLAVLARPFLQHWLGSEFSEVSVGVMRLIMAGLILSIPGIVAYEALYACGRLGPAVTAILLGGVLNLFLSIALVKIAGMGLLGVALGSAISLVAVNFFCLPLMLCRATDLPMRKLLLEAVLPALLGAIPFAVLALALHRAWPATSLILVLIQFALCGLFYAISVWFLSLTADDRLKVRRTLAAASRRVTDPSQWTNFI